MLADTFFVDADRKAYWIPFPTTPQLVEYDLPPDGPPKPRRTIELGSLEEAAASFVALVQIVRDKRYWSLMPWTQWAREESTRRLMLPNVGGTVFLSTPDGSTVKLAQGPVQHVVSAIDQAVTQLREAGFEEADVETMWSETRSRLETAYTFVERKTDDGRAIEGFVVPGHDVLVGPRLVRSGDHVTIELGHGDAVVERRGFEGGRLQTYTSAGSGAACLRWGERGLRDVLLFEWGGRVCLTLDDDDRPVVAGFDSERMTDIATFEDSDFVTFARLGVDGPEHHEIDHFFGEAPNRFARRTRLTGALSCPVPSSLDEAVTLAKTTQATLTSGRLRHTAEPCVAVLTPDYPPQFAIFGADQWSRASKEPIGARNPTVVPLSTAQRDVLVGLVGRCRDRKERSTTAYPFFPAAAGDEPACVVQAESIEPEALARAAEALGRPGLDATVDNSAVVIGEVPVARVGAVVEALGAESFVTSPPGPTEAAAFLVRVRLDGFASRHGLTLAERESGDVGLFLPEVWAKLKARIETTIEREGPVCIRHANWRLSRPFASIDDFVHATAIDTATLELLVSINPRWKPSPYGCTTLWYEPNVVGTLELVASSYLAVHEHIKATDLALGLPEDGTTMAMVGWALPAKQVTPALLDEAIGARERRLADVCLAACDLVCVDETAAVVLGVEVAGGLGLSEIPLTRITGARDRALAALAECPTWAAELEQQAPRLVVAAQGGLSRGELMVGTAGPEQSRSGLTYSRAHPTRDQDQNDASDEGVLGLRLAQAGPWRNKMFDSVALPNDPASLIKAHAGKLESDPSLYLTYAYGN